MTLDYIEMMIDNIKDLQERVARLEDRALAGGDVLSEDKAAYYERQAAYKHVLDEVRNMMVKCFGDIEKQGKT